MTDAGVQETIAGTVPEPTDPPPHRPLAPIAVAMALGVVAGRHTADLAWPVAPAIWWWSAAALAGFVMLLFSLRRRAPLQSHPSTAAAALLALACGAALMILQVQPGPHNIARLASAQGRLVTLDGVLIESPRESPRPDNPLLPQLGPDASATSLLVKVPGVTFNGRHEPAGGRVRVTVSQPLPNESQRRPYTGEQLRVTGLLHDLSLPLNPGQRDLRALYASRGIGAALKTDFWEAVDRRPADWWSAYGWMGDLRRTIDRYVPRTGEYGNQILPALFLADYLDMPNQQVQAFIQAGVMHYLAVSGAHVVLFCAMLLWLMRAMMVTQRRAALVLIVFVTVYALAIELQPSVVRAAVFFILYSLAMLCGRRPDPLNNLAGAAIIVLALNPADFFNVGFQLSFLATLGLMVTCPRIRDRLLPPPMWRLYRFQPRSVRIYWQVRKVGGNFLCTCLTASLYSIPLVAYGFHMASPVGLPATVLLFPVIFLLMMCGALAIMIAPLTGGPVGPLATALETLSRWLSQLVSWAADLPGGHFYLREFGLPWLLIFIAILLAWTWRGYLNLTRLRLALAIVLATVGYVAIGIPRGPSDELRVTVLAVGSGNTVLIQAPGGYNLLVDCGSSLLAERTADIVTAPALWKLGVGHLDAVVLTHADADHVKDLPLLMQRIGVDRVYLSRHFRATGKDYERRVIDWLAEMKLPVTYLQRGDRLPAPAGVELTVLGPPADLPADSENNATSVVLRIGYAGRVMILAGDAPPAALREMAREELATGTVKGNEPAGAGTVVLLPHHGEESPEILDFLKAFGADRAVMSVGRFRDGNRRARIDWPRELLIFRTYRDGAVTVHLTPRGTNVTTFAGSR